MCPEMTIHRETRAYVNEYALWKIYFIWTDVLEFGEQF